MNPIRRFAPPSKQPSNGGAGPRPDHTWLIVFGDVVHLVIVLAVLITALLALRMWLRHRVAPPPAPGALAELEVLYARGEVSRDDYLARRADLTHPGTAG